MKEQPSKEERKRLLIEMMKEDEKNGMYEKSDNEIIAEFMGFDVYDYGLFGKPIRVFSVKTDDLVDRALNIQHTFQLKYDTSWDWLMPVVKKCRQTVNGPWNDMTRLMFNSVYNALDRVEINEVYKATVEYIKWFNDYNSQQHERK